MPAESAQADDVRDAAWYLGSLRVSDAQTISDGAGVVVGLVDTGVNSAQPELAGVLQGGTNIGFAGDGTGDEDGHGTAMATLIAGRGYGPEGTNGVLGVARASRLLSIKTDGTSQSGVETLALGVDWAVDHGAEVICVAAGGGETELWRRVLDKAFAADVVVVAAMGNSPRDKSPGYPASYPGVVAVGATDQHRSIATFSLTGPETVLSAPGVDIPIPDSANGYAVGRGTSEATAIVAGVVALVRARFPDMSAKEVIHRLEATADDRGAPGRDDEYGYGIVNPVKALTADVPPLSPSASPSSSPTDRTPSAEPADHNARTPLVIGGLVAILLLAAGGVTIAALARRR